MSIPAQAYRERPLSKELRPTMSSPPAPAAQVRLRVPAELHDHSAVQARWRARALRYVLIYLLLACVLVTLRYQTRAVYPNLRQLNDTRTELQRQQNELSLKVQSLTSEQRVRVWALANGMLPYAQARKQRRGFGPGLSAAALPEKPTPAALAVRTVWR